MSTKLITVPGSIAHQAETTGRTWLDVLGQHLSDGTTVVVFLDTSYSMTEAGREGAPKYKTAITELAKFQSQYPGRILLVSFGEHAVIHPGGSVENFDGSVTCLLPALLEVEELVDLAPKKIRGFAITDGLIDDLDDCVTWALAHPNIVISGVVIKTGGRDPQLDAAVKDFERFCEGTGGRSYGGAPSAGEALSTVLALPAPK